MKSRMGAMILILIVIASFAGKERKFPTTEWEWWQESNVNKNNHSRNIRIKLECINSRIGTLVKELGTEQNPKYEATFNATHRQFWTREWETYTDKSEADTKKMVELIYWRLVHLDAQIKGMKSNDPIKRAVKRHRKKVGQVGRGAFIQW